MPYDIFFPQTQSAFALEHTQKLAQRQKKHSHAHVRIQTQSTLQQFHIKCTQTDMYVHYNTQPHTLSACLPESQSPFPQTILHCFLQSPNWLYPDPAHRPESETIKNSIYIPAASTWAPTVCVTTHISPHHLCVILDFRPFSIFI